jgi:hypothetical protein
VNRQTLPIAISCGLLALIAAGSANATTLMRMSDRDLAMQADAIVIGTVLRVLPGPPTGPLGITTDVEIRVDVPLKHSRPGEIIKLTLPGRPADGPGPWVEGMPSFRVGREYLVYVDQMPDGRLEVLGWQHGAAAILRGRLVGSNRPVAEVAAAIQDIVGPGATYSIAPKGQSEGLSQRRAFVRIPPGVTPTALSSRGHSGLPGPDGATALLTEGFESGFPGTKWYAYGGLGPYWDDETYRAYTGARSGYCVGQGVNPPGPYPALCASWMRSGAINLSGVSEAHLTFKLWLKTEHEYDWLYYGISWDDPDGPYDMRKVSGNSDGWVSCPGDLFEVDLSPYCGDSSVWIAFYFYSDEYVQYEGAYIDEIVLWEGNPNAPKITNISPSTVSANTDTSVTISGINFGSSEGLVGFPWGQDYSLADVTSWTNTSIQCRVPLANSGGVLVQDASDLLSDPYGYEISFAYMGLQVPDQNLPDPYHYHNAGTPDAAAEYARLDSAMGTWCSVSPCYPFGRYLGPTSTLPGVELPGGDPDSTQVMGWYESGWPWPAQAIAVCLTWPSPAGTSIAHHDIAFNGQYFTWSDSGAAGKMDIQNIATHEMGHWWGLKDLYGSADSAKTMYGIADYALTFQRTLEPDDIAGIQWIYPGKPTLNRTPSSLSFDMFQGGANPAAKTVTVSNSGNGHLSYIVTTADPWVSATPTAGNEATDMTVDVSVDGSGKAEGTYDSSITITGPPGATNSPATIPVQLVVSAEPTLEWAGTTGYETDGVDPDTGDPNSTTFTFKAKYTDPSGNAPKRARCLIQRKDCGDSWQPCRSIALIKESGDIATGAIYSGSITLTNLVLKCRFLFKDASGAEVTGDPAGFGQGPMIVAGPSLCWTGATGFETDGVDPESGPLGTNFKFQVEYSDSAGDEPAVAKLVVRRNGRIFRQKTMSAAPAGDLRLGKVYRTSVTFTKTGAYEYRFSFADASGNALGPPNNWTDGPTITGGSSGAALTSLAAVPTGGGAQLTFSLSSAANVTATVLNVAGRPIRTIVADRPLDAGLQTLLWDRRAGTGLAVPAGLYLIRVTVRDAEGGQTTALATVALR